MHILQAWEKRNPILKEHASETELDFDLDIKEDVEEECSKFGRVKHIYVDKRSAGFVYLQFDTVKAASAAQLAMHMRWYARRLISAIYMQPQVYEAKFKGEVWRRGYRPCGS